MMLPQLTTPNIKRMFIHKSPFCQGSQLLGIIHRYLHSVHDKTRPLEQDKATNWGNNLQQSVRSGCELPDVPGRVAGFEIQFFTKGSPAKLVLQHRGHTGEPIW